MNSYQKDVINYNISRGEVAEIVKRALIGADQSESGNAYSSDPGVMLRAYEALVEHTYLVKPAREFANNVIQDAIEMNREITIVDLGFGSGSQWRDLLSYDFTWGGRQLTIIGIDVPGSEPMFDAFREFLNTERLDKVKFHSVSHKFEDIDFIALKDLCRGSVIVNAILSLHHVPKKYLISHGTSREDIIHSIQGLSPKSFILVEPDSDHDTSNDTLLSRLLRHYGLVFQHINDCVPDPTLRECIKHRFFGREIANIMTCEGLDRVERHCDRDDWDRMLTRGFYKILSRDVRVSGSSVLNASCWVPR